MLVKDFQFLLDIWGTYIKLNEEPFQLWLIVCYHQSPEQITFAQITFSIYYFWLY